jgi:hypothetical protein
MFVCVLTFVPRAGGSEGWPIAKDAYLDNRPRARRVSLCRVFGLRLQFQLLHHQLLGWFLRIDANLTNTACYVILLYPIPH